MVAIRASFSAIPVVSASARDMLDRLPNEAGSVLSTLEKTSGQSLCVQF